jgi:glycine cleavage system H protein
MDTLLAAGQWLAIVIGGLLVRAAAAILVLAVIVAVVAPFMLALEVGQRLINRLRGVEHVRGFEWRRSLDYAPGHLWVAARGARLRLGLDALAARILANARAVALPPPGAAVAAGSTLARVTVNGSEVALPAPVGGVVAAVNPRLATSPEAAVHHPYGGGWLVEIAPEGAALPALWRAAEGRAWFGAEAAKLTCALEHAGGYAAADGGDPILVAHERAIDEHVDELARDILGATVTRSE